MWSVCAEIAPKSRDVLHPYAPLYPFRFGKNLYHKLAAMTPLQQETLDTVEAILEDETDPNEKTGG